MGSDRRSSGLRASDLASLLVLLLLTAVFFAPLFTGHTFTTVAGHHSAVFPWTSLQQGYHDVPQSDQADLTYPWRAFAQRELRSGTVPFWNPFSFGGEPFFANGSSALLYPPNLLAALVLPLDWAHDFVSVLHVLLAGVFMFLLVREWGGESPGALLSAVAWMFAPFNMAWLHLEVVAPVSVWLPLTLLLVARAFRRRSWAAAFGAALALAGTLSSGHLLFCGLVYAVAIMYAGGLTVSALLFPAVRSETSQPPIDPDRRRSALLRFLVIAGAPAAFGAVVLLPTALYLRTLGRSSLSYEAARAATRVPYRVFLFLLHPPNLPVSELTMHQMAYAGSATALLAIIGFFCRAKGAWLGRLLVVGIFLLATDTVVLRWAYLLVPNFSFFSPLGRLLNLFVFGVVVLAGVGLNAVTRPARTGRLIIAAVFIAFTAFDLMTYGSGLNPTFAPRVSELLYPETPLIREVEEFARNGTAPGRVFPVRQSQRAGWTPPMLFAAESMKFGIDSAGGYDSTVPSRAEDVWRFVSGEELEQIAALTHRRAFRTSYEVDRVRFYMLPRLGITGIATPPGLSGDAAWMSGPAAQLDLRESYRGSDGQVFRLGRATGGPWLVCRAAIVDTAPAALARFVDPGFDERREVVVERQDLETAGIAPADVAEQGCDVERSSASVTRDGTNGLELLVHATGRSWVVIPNTWDSGWSAEVDSHQTRVLRANYTQQALRIDGGDSRIRLSYRPRGLRAGAAISGLSLLAAAAFFVRRRS